MKQEQLKKLAKWGGVRLMSLGDETLAIAIPFQVNEIEGNLPDKLWQPHKDSNQLDMLKLKYIKEAKIGEAKIKYHNDGTRLIVRSVDVINTDTAFEKSENECWLIVILNYIENK